MLVDLNVGHDTRLNADFCASITEHGVLVPIVAVAVRTTDGILRVGYGHRRTLAAVQTGRATVPVVIAADEATDDAATVERLVTQWAENEQRTGLTTAERADVIGQLSAFGVSPIQIARHTRATRGEVTAALAVHGFELARAATARYDFLDLIQAAVVAEFDADPEAVKALVVEAREGRFDHVAQRLRDDRRDTAARAAVGDRLREQGVRVIDKPTGNEPARELHRLADADGARLTGDTHQGCQGHAAYVGQKHGWRLVDRPGAALRWWPALRSGLCRGGRVWGCGGSTQSEGVGARPVKAAFGAGCAGRATPEPGPATLTPGSSDPPHTAGGQSGGDSHTLPAQLRCRSTARHGHRPPGRCGRDRDRPRRQRRWRAHHGQARRPAAVLPGPRRGRRVRPGRSLGRGSWRPARSTGTPRRRFRPIGTSLSSQSGW